MGNFLKYEKSDMSVSDLDDESPDIKSLMYTVKILISWEKMID